MNPINQHNMCSNHDRDIPPDDLEDECIFCGEPCEGSYCSKECKKAYEAEN